jgi:hypothetical protein
MAQKGSPEFTTPPGTSSSISCASNTFTAPGGIFPGPGSTSTTRSASAAISGSLSAVRPDTVPGVQQGMPVSISPGSVRDRAPGIVSINMSRRTPGGTVKAPNRSSGLMMTPSREQRRIRLPAMTRSTVTAS